MPRSEVRPGDRRAVQSYLVAYNFAQGLGWLFVALKLVKTLADTTDFRTAYAAAGGLVCKLQLIAFLEVIHASLGLVRSSPLTAFMQWAGRTHVLLAVIDKLPEIQMHYCVFLTLAAWSITEIIRYPQYGLSSLNVCPPWLTWLRYTLFIPLYPAGVYGEMLAMYVALDPIRERNLYSKLFSKLPFDYHSFIIGLLVLYPLLFLVLYRHMFKQRRTKVKKERPAPKKERVE